jgi:hypothetical protein
MYRPKMILFTVASLIVSVVIVRAVAPAAGTDETNRSSQNGVPVYDLHVGQPNMKHLPVHEIPLP